MVITRVHKRVVRTQGEYKRIQWSLVCFKKYILHILGLNSCRENKKTKAYVASF